MTTLSLGLQVLRNLPFLAELPQRFFDLVVAKGLLLKYDKDDVIWAPPEAGEEEDDTSGGAPCERSGIFIVIAGLISRSFRNADGKTEVGCGTLIRSTGSLDMEHYPMLDASMTPWRCQTAA